MDLLSDELTNLIGDKFNYDQLKILLWVCTGDREFINGVANEIEPRRSVAYKVIVAIMQSGLETRFFALTVAARPEDNRLRGIVAAACPTALQPEPEIAKDVAKMVAALQDFREFLRDEPSTENLPALRAELTTVLSKIEELEFYKNLHDALHEIQLGQLSQMEIAAKQLAKDPNQADILQEFSFSIRKTYAGLEAVSKRVPRGGLPEGADLPWIEVLGKATTTYIEAIESASPQPARVALVRIRTILEAELPRLNKEIYSAACGLHLVELGEALEKTCAPGETMSASLRALLDSIRNVRTSIFASVAEHHVWQDVDVVLWILEARLQFSPLEAVDQFNLIWPQSKLPVQALIQASLGADWAVRVQRYMDRVDDEVLALDGLLAEHDPDSSEMPPQLVARLAALRVAFRQFQREARFRFYAVDKALLVDSAELLKIAEPVGAILGEI